MIPSRSSASKEAIAGGGSLTSIRFTKQAVPAASSIDGWRHGSRGDWDGPPRPLRRNCQEKGPTT